MLRWVILVLFWGSFSIAADKCEDGVASTESTCHADLIDPVFQRAHKTSPRTNTLIYDLSQKCVISVADCFDKCGDSRFRDGNKFNQVLQQLRAPLGDQLVTEKTIKCRSQLNQFAKKVVTICEKFKVHQSAAAKVSDSEQRILSEHCSDFSTYLKPIPNDDSKKTKDKEKKQKDKGRDQAAGKASVGTLGVEAGGINTSGFDAGDDVTQNYSSPDGDKNRRDSEDNSSVGNDTLPIGVPGRPKDKVRGDVVPKGGGKPDFIANSPSTFQPITGKPQKAKNKRRRQGALPMKKQREGLSGNIYHGSKVADPGSGQAVGRQAQPSKVPPATIQELQRKLVEKMVGGADTGFVEEEKVIDNKPSELFNKTKRTFRKYRRNNEFIE